MSVELSRKWYALAVQRRDHLADLYHSGRWRRYFTEQEFLALMRDTVKSVENWAALAFPNGVPANDQGSPRHPSGFVPGRGHAA